MPCVPHHTSRYDRGVTTGPAPDLVAEATLPVVLAGLRDLCLAHGTPTSLCVSMATRTVVATFADTDTPNRWCDALGLPRPTPAGDELGPCARVEAQLPGTNWTTVFVARPTPPTRPTPEES